MGSHGKGKDGEGTSGLKDDDKYEPQLRFHTPTATAPQCNWWCMAQRQMQDGYVERVVHQRLKRVNITWNHPVSRDVAVIGSWDNWETRDTLHLQSPPHPHAYAIVKALPTGIYHYRFIVDGYLTHAPEFPWAFDHSGFPYNILDLQDYIPETAARLGDAQDPPSPPWTYDNMLLNDDEFGRPPPELPPQLPLTTRDDPSSSSTVLPRPSHLELNHLYIHKTDGGDFAALRSTEKFGQKYVSMVLYKSLPRER
ncbi:hypothetical protein HN873_057792 [Arachis hypogaea]|uniref:Association with the SNF1 complex (ASC) domain-containing protein n=2 Tax=Arachis hypogaea TaxID=3818 RepID=A0A444YFZ7_ARAHY|nr:hypothetical protein Ahy_B07g088928 isoform A [Arachis hypogaea]